MPSMQGKRIGAVLAALSTSSLASIASAELAAALAAMVTKERPIAHILQALAELDVAARLGRWSRTRIEAKLPRYILGVRPRGETRTRRGEEPRASVTYRDIGRDPTPPPVDTRALATGGRKLIAALQCAC